MVHLYMSSQKAWKASFALPNGRVIYKVDSPVKRISRRVVIDKVEHNEFLDEGAEDTFARLAEIDWHTNRPSKLTVGGTVKDITKLFTDMGNDWKGTYRVFQDPNGVEYKWTLEHTRSEVRLKDDPKTLVAKYHYKHVGQRLLFRKPRPASLEIFPAGEHILDLILVLFVHTEYMRRMMLDGDEVEFLYEKRRDDQDRPKDDYIRP